MLDNGMMRFIGSLRGLWLLCFTTLSISSESRLGLGFDLSHHSEHDRSTRWHQLVREWRERNPAERCSQNIRCHTSLSWVHRWALLGQLEIYPHSKYDCASLSLCVIDKTQGIDLCHQKEGLWLPATCHKSLESSFEHLSKTK